MAESRWLFCTKAPSKMWNILLCPFTQKKLNELHCSIKILINFTLVNNCHNTKSVKNLKIMNFHHNFITSIPKLASLNFEKAHNVLEARPRCYVFVFVCKFFWVILRKNLLGRKIRLGKSQIANRNTCYTCQFLYAYQQIKASMKTNSPVWRKKFLSIVTCFSYCRDLRKRPEQKVSAFW